MKPKYIKYSNTIQPVKVEELANSKKMDSDQTNEEMRNDHIIGRKAKPFKLHRMEGI